MYHGTLTNAIGIAWLGRSGSRLPALLGRDFRLFEPGLARFNSEFRGRQALARVMPEGHGNVPHKKARDRDAIVAMHGECAITVLISPHHSSTTGQNGFRRAHLALCMINRCALQHHLIRNYACDRPRRSMFKIEQTPFFSSATLPGMGKPRLDAPDSPVFDVSTIA